MRRPEYFIYRILNLNNSRYYIGCTMNIDARVLSHMTSLYSQTHIIRDMNIDYNLGHKFEVSLLESISSTKKHPAFRRRTWAEHKYIACDLAYNLKRIYGLSGLKFKEPLGQPLFCFTKRLWIKKDREYFIRKRELYIMRVT